jgi:hypothetical protein
VVDGACTASVFHDPVKEIAIVEPVRLYVSGPMSGYPECNYPAFFDATDRLRDAGYIVSNPAEVGASGGQYTDLLKKDIRLLLDCEGVAVLEGWWASRGAQAEISVAGVLNLPVRPVQEWLDRARKVDGAAPLP